MAFQDRAESLAERLHLGRVPRSVFVAVALALVLMIVLAGYAFCASLGGGFEVRAQDAASASVSGDAGNEAVQAVEGEEGDAEKAQAALKTVTKRLDMAAAKHVIHKNQASNRKSGLAKLVNSINA